MRYPVAYVSSPTFFITAFSTLGYAIIRVWLDNHVGECGDERYKYKISEEQHQEHKDADAGKDYGDI